MNEWKFKKKHARRIIVDYPIDVSVMDVSRTRLCFRPQFAQLGEIISSEYKKGPKVVTRSLWKRRSPKKKTKKKKQRMEAKGLGIERLPFQFYFSARPSFFIVFRLSSLSGEPEPRALKSNITTSFFFNANRVLIPSSPTTPARNAASIPVMFNNSGNNAIEYILVVVNLFMRGCMCNEVWKRGKSEGRESGFCWTWRERETPTSGDKAHARRWHNQVSSFPLSPRVPSFH